MNLKLATLAITLNLVSSLAVAKNSRDQKNDSFINNRVPWITRGNHAATPVNGAKANSVQYKEKWAGIEDKSMKNGRGSKETPGIEAAHIEENKMDMDIVKAKKGERSLQTIPIPNFTQVTFPGGSTYTSAVAIGDVNNDGYADIVVGDTSQDNHLLINDGSGGFLSSITLPGSNMTTMSIAMGDVNNDGYVDVIVGNRDLNNGLNQHNQLLLSDGSGNYTSAADLPGGVHETWSIILIDVNGDSSLDIIIGNHTSVNQLLLNDGNGEFNVIELPGGIRSTLSVAVGDVNNDGKHDIVIGNFWQTNQLLLNDGTGNFLNAIDLPGGEMLSEAISLGDFNEDEYLDIVVANSNAFDQMILNDGMGGFTNVMDLPVSSMAIATGDLNSDGHVDIVSGSYGLANHLLLNDGMANFLDTILPSGNFPTSAIAVGDLNKDGRIDIVVGNFDNPNQLLLNDGQSETTTTTTSSTEGATFKDLIGKSISALCSIDDAQNLTCSASTDAYTPSGVLMTNLAEGTCSVGTPATIEGPEKSIALAVDVTCKNSGTCSFKHCFRADYVIYDTSVIAAMFEVDSTVVFNKDGTFSVDVQTAAFIANNTSVAASVAPIVIAKMGECGSSYNSTPLMIGETAAVCISTDGAVQLSLKSVTANPGGQTLVNEFGETNFVTLLTNQGTNQVTLETLMIPAYFDAQGGSAGSITITGTALISYTARHLENQRSIKDVEEAPFDLEVPYIYSADIPEVAQVKAEEENGGGKMDLGFFNAYTAIAISAMILLLKTFCP